MKLKDLIEVEFLNDNTDLSEALFLDYLTLELGLINDDELEHNINEMLNYDDNLNEQLGFLTTVYTNYRKQKRKSNINAIDFLVYPIIASLDVIMAPVTTAATSIARPIEYGASKIDLSHIKQKINNVKDFMTQLQTSLDNQQKSEMIKQLSSEYNLMIRNDNKRVKAFKKLLFKRLPKECPGNKGFYRTINFNELADFSKKNPKLIIKDGKKFNKEQRDFLKDEINDIDVLDIITGDKYANLVYNDLTNGTKTLHSYISKKLAPLLKDIHRDICDY